MGLNLHVCSGSQAPSTHGSALPMAPGVLSIQPADGDERCGVWRVTQEFYGLSLEIAYGISTHIPLSELSAYPTAGESRNVI